MLALLALLVLDVSVGAQFPVPWGEPRWADDGHVRAASCVWVISHGSRHIAVDPSGNIATDFLGASFSGAPPNEVFPSVGSLLVGAASAPQLVSDDFNGTPRDGALDAGAYKFDAAGNPGWVLTPGFKSDTPVGEGGSAEGGASAEGGGQPAGGNGAGNNGSGANGSGGGAGSDEGSDDGCSCRVGEHGGSAAGWLALAAIAAIASRKRR